MLTLRPQLPPTRSPDSAMLLQRRGRSRQVSHAALARQASEERAAATVSRRLYVCATMALPAEHMQAERNSPSMPSEKSDHVPHLHVPEPSVDASLPPIRVPVVAVQEPVILAPVPVILAPVPVILAPVPVKAAPAPTFLPSRPTLPPSLDYYDSPPSPPRTLEDQVHVAYALDNMHLAKVLLLKLKGIEVTSDDDPRIAAVQDEDFDFCFVPHGRLLDEADEKALLEQQRKETERFVEQRREARLNACGRIWELEKRRLREEKAAVLRKREAEEKRRAEDERRRAAEEERRRLAEEAVAAAKAERANERARLYKLRAARATAKSARNVVSYDVLGQSRPDPSSTPSLSTAATTNVVEPFVYDFMRLPPQSATSDQTKGKSRPQPQAFQSPFQSQVPSQSQPFSRPSYDDSRSVFFKDVLASMRGPLFPIERRSTSPSHSTSHSSSKDRRRRRENELLDSLLKVVEWEENERKRRKGKWAERPLLERKRSDRPIISSCAACSASSLTPPLPSTSALSPSPTSSSSSWLSSPLSSPRSWLSFGSASSSASTAATTPPTSPSAISAIPNWLTKPSSSTRRRSPFLSLITSNPASTSTSNAIHCCHLHSHLSPIPLSESPLPIPSHPASPKNKHYTTSNTLTSHSNGPTHTSNKNAARLDGVGQVTWSVSRFVELAKGLQNAYMNAALFSIAASTCPSDDRERSATAFEVCAAESEWQHLSLDGNGTVGRRSRPGRTGYRACAADVAIFLDLALNTPEDHINKELTSMSIGQPVLAPPIPLRSYSSDPLRTILPDPLPYPIVFKPLPVPSRSPFRLHSHVSVAHTSPAYSPNRNNGDNYRTFPPVGSAHAPWASHTGGEGMGRGYGGTVMWRVRTVENPVYLRLKALNTVLWDRGMNWQGRAREGSMGTGREKVLKLAFEGIGRSWLGVEYEI